MHSFIWKILRTALGIIWKMLYLVLRVFCSNDVILICRYIINKQIIKRNKTEKKKSLASLQDKQVIYFLCSWLASAPYPSFLEFTHLSGPRPGSHPRSPHSKPFFTLCPGLGDRWHGPQDAYPALWDKTHGTADHVTGVLYYPQPRRGWSCCTHF